MTQPEQEQEGPVQTDNRPRPEDGDQSGLSQDPAVDYTVGSQ